MPTATGLGVADCDSERSGGESLFAIVTVLWVVEMKLTLVALLSLTRKVSSGSTEVSPIMGMLILAELAPAGIVNVPEVAT